MVYVVSIAVLSAKLLLLTLIPFTCFLYKFCKYSQEHFILSKQPLWMKLHTKDFCITYTFHGFWHSIFRVCRNSQLTRAVFNTLMMKGININ